MAVTQPDERQILHADMDAFYASVEQHDDPALRGRPVIVGGDLRRGVVSACSYEARAFGVHSAMPMAVALKRCPQALVRRVRMVRYREVSQAVMAIFGAFTDRVEAISIDEAFLDVSGCQRLFGAAPAIAAEIRRRVRTELGLAVSIGIAPNKFLAKLASQRAKPDGLLAIAPDAVAGFLAPLPVADLWGVGRVTAGRLQDLGIVTVADLLVYPEGRLVARFGHLGRHLLGLAHGRDSRPVVASDGLKSVSHETTFTSDLVDLGRLQRELHGLAQQVAARLRRHGLAGRQVTLKLRYDDFTTVTRSRTLERTVDHGGKLYRIGLELLERTEAGRRPVRLLGIGVADWRADEGGQSDLFAEPDEAGRERALDRAMDRVNERFGAGRLAPASLLKRNVSGSEEGGDGGQ